VQRIVALWNAATGRADRSLAEAVESAADAADRMRDLLRHSIAPDFTPECLLDRFDHFLVESFEIIPRAAEALARVDLETFGALTDRSQQRAEALLRNQIPETIALARLARGHGADAASAFGAGFGGSVWAMIDRASAAGFAERWRDSYRRAFPEAERDAEFIVTGPGPGAMSLATLAAR
jgi:galactokinase